MPALVHHGDNLSCHAAAQESWVLFAPMEQRTSCLRWYFHLKDLTARNLVALFFFLSLPQRGAQPGDAGGRGCTSAGRQSQLPVLERNPALALSAAGLKQSYRQQSHYVKAHTPPQQNCSLRTLELELLTFLTKKPVFTIVSTAEPWSSGRVSWLLFCFAHHQQNCQLISYCRIFIMSNDLWGRMSTFLLSNLRWKLQVGSWKKQIFDL